jgi:hypothetical protein
VEPDRGRRGRVPSRRLACRRRASAQAIRVAGDTGQHAWHGCGLTLYARLAGACGRPTEGCEAAQAALAIAESAAMRSGQRFSHGAMGFVELSSGRVDEAIAELETVEQIVDGSGLDDPRSCRGRRT